MAGTLQLYQHQLINWIQKILAFCEDPMAAAHSIVLSRHCAVMKSLVFSEMC